MSNYSDLQNMKLLQLLNKIDSFELKASVPSKDHGRASMALGLDPIEAEIRQVFFFDTRDLQLNQAGVVVRARRIQGGKADTAIKLRPVDPESLPDKFRRSGAMKVEVDSMPNGFVCSASMKGKATASEVRQAAEGRRPLKDIFTQEQRRFLKTYAPQGLKLSDLELLGPIFTLKLEYSERELGRDFTVEAWLYPDHSQILELSTKCEPSEAFQVGAELKSFLLSKEIDLNAEQQTKTKTTLEYFAAKIES